MAGSLNHIVGKRGRFKLDTIDNMGDAAEALEECFGIIYQLSNNGNKDIINEACKEFNYPEIKCDMILKHRNSDLCGNKNNCPENKTCDNGLFCRYYKDI